MHTGAGHPPSLYAFRLVIYRQHQWLCRACSTGTRVRVPSAHGLGVDTFYCDDTLCPRLAPCTCNARSAVGGGRSRGCCDGRACAQALTRVCFASARSLRHPHPLAQSQGCTGTCPRHLSHRAAHTGRPAARTRRQAEPPFLGRPSPLVFALPRGTEQDRQPCRARAGAGAGAADPRALGAAASFTGVSQCRYPLVEMNPPTQPALIPLPTNTAALVVP